MKDAIIILVETQLEENLGAAARSMLNFGLDKLRLVNPKVAPTHPKAIATAAGAEKILYQAPVFSSLQEAVADLVHVFGTTATEREMIKRYYEARVFAEEFAEREKDVPLGIVFGPERTGLSNEDLACCYGAIHIPVNAEFSSLNLAQAVAVVAYEWHQTQKGGKKSYLHLGQTKPASQDQLRYFLKSLEQKLDEASFWRTPTKKPIMWRNLQNIFTRMDLTEQEVRTLCGVVDFLNKNKPSK